MSMQRILVSAVRNNISIDKLLKTSVAPSLYYVLFQVCILRQECEIYFTPSSLLPSSRSTINHLSARAFLFVTQTIFLNYMLIRIKKYNCPCLCFTKYSLYRNEDGNCAHVITSFSTTYVARVRWFMQWKRKMLSFSPFLICIAFGQMQVWCIGADGH